MKKLFFATSAIAVLAMAAPAGAADLPIRKAPVYKAPPAAVVTSWTGCYAGGHVGYSWSDWQDNVVPGARATTLNPIADPGDPIVFGYNGSFKTDGFAGGLQFGCDYQYGVIVVGLVSDISWTSQSQTSNPFAIVPVNPPISSDEFAHVKLEAFGTARARVGWAYSNNFLFYATGGLAWARAQVSYNGQVANGGAPLASFAVSDETYHIGWALGVGVDYRFGSNWTVGVEYLHLDLGNANYRFGNTFPNVTSTEALGSGTNFDLRTDIVRVTANYRFWNSIYAKY